MAVAMMEPEEMEGPQQQSHLHCAGVLLRLEHHCLSSHFNSHQEYRQLSRRPTKILTIVVT